MHCFLNGFAAYLEGAAAANSGQVFPVTRVPSSVAEPLRIAFRHRDVRFVYAFEAGT